LTLTDSFVSTKCSEITSLIAEVKVWSRDDAKLGAHLATYIDVMILGMLEECVEHLIKTRAALSGDIEVSNYISKHIEDKFRNPNFGLICGILGQFSDRYKEEFERTFKKDSPEVVAMDGLLKNKTNVAHYGLANLTLSVNDVEIYFNGVVNILAKLEEILS
jgi:hypothetical protein